MITNKPMTLCWTCENACGNCSWSDGTFTPVEGWTATPTKLWVNHSINPGEKGALIDSFHVTACPLYENDEDQYNQPTKRDKWNSAPYLQDE